jgi:hypothetical protein
MKYVYDPVPPRRLGQSLGILLEKLGGALPHYHHEHQKDGC